MTARRAGQADALAKWADEVDVDDLIEAIANNDDSSLATLGRSEASAAPEVSSEH